MRLRQPETRATHPEKSGLLHGQCNPGVQEAHKHSLGEWAVFWSICRSWAQSRGWRVGEVCGGVKGPRHDSRWPIPSQGQSRQICAYKGHSGHSWEPEVGPYGTEDSSLARWGDGHGNFWGKTVTVTQESAEMSVGDRGRCPGGPWAGI